MLTLLLALAAIQPEPASSVPKATDSWEATGGFIGLRVSSLPASIAWYRDVLGFETIAHNQEYRFAVLRRGGTLVELNGGGERAVAAPGAAAATGPHKFGLVVSDFDLLQAQLAERKIPLQGRIIRSDADGLRTLAIEDPDGNLLQFFGR